MQDHGARAATPPPFGDVIRSILDRSAERSFISTRIKMLDLVFGGGLRQHGYFVLVCGESETGKSLLLQNMIFRMAVHAIIVLVDFENGEVRLAQRLKAMAETAPPNSRLPSLVPHLATILSRLFVYEGHLIRSPRDIAEAVVDAISIKQYGHPSPVVLFIDGLHKLPRLSNDKRLNVDLWTQQLEALSRQHRIPVVVTTEVARTWSADDPVKDSNEPMYAADFGVVFRGTSGARKGKVLVFKDRDSNDRPREFYAQVNYPWVIIEPAPASSSEFDEAILRVIQANRFTTAADVGKAVGRSKSAVLKRLDALERKGNVGKHNGVYVVVGSSGSEPLGTGGGPTVPGSGPYKGPGEPTPPDPGQTPDPRGAQAPLASEASNFVRTEIAGGTKAQRSPRDLRGKR